MEVGRYWAVTNGVSILQGGFNSPHPTKSITMNKMNQFLRIANARLKKVYPNKIQRKAWAANMWRRYVERQNIEHDL